MTDTSSILSGSTAAVIPVGKHTVWRGAGVVAACIALGVGSHALGAWIEQSLGLKAPDVRALIDARMFAILLLLYVLLLALPFVPGAEVGVCLLMVFGAQAAIPVYGTTVAALILSFMVGRLVPQPRLLAGLRRVGLSRAAEVLASDISPTLRATGTTSHSRWTGAMLARVLKHRCIALGILFNTPGNSILGGGGGIALAVGASRLMTFRQFVVTILIAVAPVPAVILLASLLPPT